MLDGFWGGSGGFWIGSRGVPTRFSGILDESPQNPSRDRSSSSPEIPRILVRGLLDHHESRGVLDCVVRWFIQNPKHPYYDSSGTIS